MKLTEITYTQAIKYYAEYPKKPLFYKYDCLEEWGLNSTNSALCDGDDVRGHFASGKWALNKKGIKRLRKMEADAIASITEDNKPDEQKDATPVTDIPADAESEAAGVEYIEPPMSEDDAQELADWRGFHLKATSGTPIWPNKWSQNVAMIAYTIHSKDNELAELRKDKERLDWVLNHVNEASEYINMTSDPEGSGAYMTYWPNPATCKNRQTLDSEIHAERR